MPITRLNNKVFFKKVFTDPEIFRAFVKDITGIEVNPEKIETEKGFEPKTGNIGFKYDIFAEDVEKRVIIEIQKVEYDHNFDRFLHYHLQAITEQQRTSEDYSIPKTVYTIVVITAPYRKNIKGELVRDEVLISNLNPQNLKGAELPIFNHKLIFLNPNYKGVETPENYRDWLDLVYESIHHSENPRINENNPNVKKAAALINYEQISPEEWEQAKIEASKLKVLELTYKDGVEEGIEKTTHNGIEKALRRGKLTITEIAEDFNITEAYVLEVKAELGI